MKHTKEKQMKTPQTPDECLLQAQMHIECINDAWLEFTEAFKDITLERKEVVRDEIGSRIWAAIYLIQYRNDPGKMADSGVQKVLREANAHNGIDEESDADVSGLH